MISLFAAVFGKDHLHPLLRYGLLAVGLAGLAYRVRKHLATPEQEPEIKITVKPATPIVKIQQPKVAAGLGYYR